MKFKIMLIVMGLLVVGMAIYSIAALYVNDATVVVNTTSDAVNTVEYSLTELSNGLEAENLTFSGAQSFIRYFNVPKNANFTSAILNVSGIPDYKFISRLGDISGGGAPNYLNSPRSVYVSGDVAYVVSSIDNVLTTFNISDLSNIIHMDAITGTGAPNYLSSPYSVYVSGDVAYVVSASDDALTTFNVTNAANIIHMGNISGGGAPNYLNSPRSVYVSGDVAYVVSNNDNALTAFNVTNASNIIQMDAITGLGGPRSVYVSGDVAYVVSNSNNALITFNVTNASNIIQMDDISGVGSPNYLSAPLSVYVSGDVAYVASSGDTALTAFNVTNASNIIHMDAITGAGAPNYLSSPRSVYVSGDVAYVVSNYDNALTAFNVTNASNIIHIDSIYGIGGPNYLNTPTSVYVSGDVAYVVSNLDDALTTFTILNFFDISDVTIDIGNDGDVEFNHSGSLSTTNLTNDFSSEINDCLINLCYRGTNCYQETASTATACGGFDSGVYSYSGNWDAPLRIATSTYDGDWDTVGAAAPPSEDTAYLYIDYTKPTNALQSSSMWLVKDSCGIYELNIPQACWESDTDVLSFQVISTGIGQVYWKCYNGADYTTLKYCSMHPKYIYEEAMWWNISNGNVNIPINITANNGKMLAYAINITYDSNISTLFTRNDTYTWNESTTGMTPNTKYKRRYSINPTSDVLSNNLNITGYYMRNWTASECEVNNKAYTVTSNYCIFLDNMSQGYVWNLTYIWDNNISGIEGDIAINMTNTSTLASDILYHNFTIYYKDADNVSAASASTFTNTTIEGYLNSTIGINQKIKIQNTAGGFSDITPSSFNTCPTLERISADSRIFHTCMNTSTRPNYYMVKIESSN